MALAPFCIGLHIGRILQHPPYGAAVPVRFSRVSLDARFVKTAHHLSNAQTPNPYPVDNLSYRRCLGQVDDILGRRPIPGLSDIALTVECRGKHIDAAAFGPM